MTDSRRASMAVAILLLGFWLVSLYGLAITPPVYEDEPWQASTGWKLATEGVFGSDMFAGYYNMDQRYYDFMPLHPAALALVFRIAGPGLFQARLETVVFGLLTLCLTYALGKRLFGTTVGLLAVALLLGLRLLATGRFQETGIPLFDFARIARYDMVVPVFGIAALHAYITAMHKKRLVWYGASGLLAALAGLSHLYGVFFLVVLLVLVAWNRDGWRALGMLVAGFVLPWLAYGAYVLGDLPDWRGQTKEYGPRFDLLNPAWYLDNLRSEAQRYQLGVATGRGWLRPGLWLTAILLPAAWIGLARDALTRHDRHARVLLTGALLMPALFALLITSKLANYLISFMPLWALSCAWAAVALWRWSRGVRRGAIVRVALAVTFSAMLAEGASQVARNVHRARETTPYRSYIAEVRQHIPTGSTVLGLHQFWFGLEDFPYRSWFVPIVLTDPAYHDPPLTASQAMAAIDPDVILVDPKMRAFLTAPESDSSAIDPGTFLDWMTAQGFALDAQVDDPTYGLMEIYRRSAP